MNAPYALPDLDVAEIANVDDDLLDRIARTSPIDSHRAAATAVIAARREQGMSIRIVPGVFGGEFLLVEHTNAWGKNADLGTFERRDDGIVEWANRNYSVRLGLDAKGRGEINWGSSGAKSPADTLLFANLLATAAGVAKVWEMGK